jgi:hypothetical protein
MDDNKMYRERIAFLKAKYSMNGLAVEGLPQSRERTIEDIWREENRRENKAFKNYFSHTTFANKDYWSGIQISKNH